MMADEGLMDASSILWRLKRRRPWNWKVKASDCLSLSEWNVYLDYVSVGRVYSTLSGWYAVVAGREGHIGEACQARMTMQAALEWLAGSLSQAARGAGQEVT